MLAISWKILVANCNYSTVAEEISQHSKAFRLRSNFQSGQALMYGPTSQFKNHTYIQKTYITYSGDHWFYFPITRQNKERWRRLGPDVLKISKQICTYPATALLTYQSTWILPRLHLKAEDRRLFQNHFDNDPAEGTLRKLQKIFFRFTGKKRPTYKMEVALPRTMCGIIF